MKKNVNPYISLNPYRIIGVQSNSGVKEIHKNLSKLKAYAQLDKKVEFDYDFNFLNLAEVERNNEIISKVESRILLDENKVKYSLFWFLDASSYDSIALSNLIKGNTEKAIDIWKKATKSNEVTSKNYSAFNNLATLLLLVSLEDSKSDLFSKSKDSIHNLRQALNYKCALMSSDFFKNFCNEIGITTAISVSEIQIFFATTILEIININFSNEELVDLVDGLDESFASIVNTNLVKSPISNIKNNIKEASKDLTENEENGILIGKNLIKNSNKDLMYLKQTLGATDYQYEAIADKLANQILQCGILYYNATKEDQAYLSSYKYALSISIQDKTKLRAENAIEHCEEEKKANVCPSCNLNNININKPLYLTLYKITERNYWSNTVKYSQVQLKIFFCPTCHLKISKNNDNKLFFSIGVALLAALFGYLSDAGGGSIFLALIGFVIAYWLGGLFFGEFERDGFNKSKIVREYRSDGWQDEKPGK
ncbi:MAG: hypothetical protein KA210_01335 [Bacteroidia bacterium]|nr:hypothetical protein [Bacteroidia bacterium]